MLFIVSFTIKNTKQTNKRLEIMKRLRISFVVAMLAMVIVASAQISLGVKGGLNMSNFSGDGADNTKMKLGYQVGVFGDYEFMPNMAIQSGLFFTTKGAKLSETSGEKKVGDIKISSSAEITANAMYLQAPIHFVYKIDVTPGTRVVFRAGPYLAYGIGGKMKGNVDVKISGNVPASMKDAVDKYVKQLNDQIKDYNTFEKDTGLKRFDAGLGVGAGIELGQFLVDIGWDMGLINISNEKKGNIKSQNAYLSVGYKF